MSALGLSLHKERARVRKLLKTLGRSFSQERKSSEVVQMDGDIAGERCENHFFGYEEHDPRVRRGSKGFGALLDWRRSHAILLLWYIINNLYLVQSHYCTSEIEAGIGCKTVATIVCDKGPAFQRRHTASFCSAESPNRFPCFINTTLKNGFVPDGVASTV
jgi:hypothetical protein